MKAKEVLVAASKKWCAIGFQGNHVRYTTGSKRDKMSRDMTRPVSPWGSDERNRDDG